MNKIQTAAKILREIARNTTDAAAFRVESSEEEEEKGKVLYLRPDYKRRESLTYMTGATFFHTCDLVCVCQALKLHFFITSRIVYRSEDPLPSSEFMVRIYEI